MRPQSCHRDGFHSLRGCFVLLVLSSPLLTETKGKHLNGVIWSYITSENISTSMGPLLFICSVYCFKWDTLSASLKQNIHGRRYQGSCSETNIFSFHMDMDAHRQTAQLCNSALKVKLVFQNQFNSLKSSIDLTQWTVYQQQYLNTSRMRKLQVILLNFLYYNFHPMTLNICSF